MATRAGLMLSRLTFIILALASTAAAQPQPRRATNLAALIAHPAFYHLRPVVLVGTMSQQDTGELRMTDEAGTLRVVFKGNAPDGLDEIRGEFWDLGRMNADDPRLAGYDLRATFGIDPDGAWPRPGQVTALIASAIAPTTPPA